MDQGNRKVGGNWRIGGELEQLKVGYATCGFCGAIGFEMWRC
jgi:hypothetical protein